MNVEGAGARLLAFAEAGDQTLTRLAAGVAGTAVGELPASMPLACGCVLAVLWLLGRYHVRLVSLYLALALYFASERGDPGWFVLASSFAHYPVYLATLQFCRASPRTGVPSVSREWYQSFKTQCPVLRTVAWAHLIDRAVRLLLVQAMVADPGGRPRWTVGSLVAVAGAPVAVVAAGLGLATLAYGVLGHDGTFFGYEMGFYRRAEGPVTAFPYSTLPHPMILGDIVALCGFFLVPGFTADPSDTGLLRVWAWVVPAHIAAYIVVLLHEVAITKGWLGEGGPPADMPPPLKEGARRPKED